MRILADKINGIFSRDKCLFMYKISYFCELYMDNFPQEVLLRGKFYRHSVFSLLFTRVNLADKVRMPRLVGVVQS